MDEFDPTDITQDHLHKLRTAAESAWGDDTRHPQYEGHPNMSAGQCYVTSRWMTKKLGGHVGVTNGHYVWVSPDKQYVVDLTGDRHATPPADLRYHGMRLDEDDDGWIPTEDQKRWQPGPITYTKANHAIHKGLRVKTFKTENERSKLFSKRADHAYDSA